MQGQIAQVKQQAPKTPCQLQVTFKQDAIDKIPKLLNMAVARIVKMKSLLDVAVLIDVAQCNRWEPESNRTLVIEFSNSWDKRFFFDEMHNAFEKIETVG